MAFRDYTDKVVESGDALLSYTANEAVKRGQLVKVLGEDLGVAPSDADGEEAIGFATQTVSAGDTVTVATSGCEVVATSGTGTIARGDFVASYGLTGNEGEVDTATKTVMSDGAAAGTRGDYIVGMAIENDVGANDDVRVLVDLGGLA